MRTIRPAFYALALIGAPGLSLLPPAQALADDATVIDQAAALAGQVTAGDAPGFPITLDRAGRYRLGGDLKVPADTSGIEITGPDVVLDLGGHHVSGPVRCTRQEKAKAKTMTCDVPSRFSAVVGIRSVSAASAVIRNGTVEGFAGLGVHYGEASVLDMLRVHSNAGVGIAGMGYATPGLLRDVRVERNGGPGIVCEHMRIERSAFVGNGGTGVDCRGSWFSGSVTSDNSGPGVVEGPRAGLRSHGNRLPDEAGLAADRVPIHLVVTQGIRSQISSTNRHAEHHQLEGRMSPATRWPAPGTRD